MRILYSVGAKGQNIHGGTKPFELNDKLLTLVLSRMKKVCRRRLEELSFRDEIVDIRLLHNLEIVLLFLLTVLQFKDRDLIASVRVSSIGVILKFCKVAPFVFASLQLKNFLLNAFFKLQSEGSWPAHHLNLVV